MTELSGQTGQKEGIPFLYNVFKLTHLEDDIYSSRRIRGNVMQVFLQMVAFSLQNDVSGRPVLTKGKHPETLKGHFVLDVKIGYVSDQVHFCGEGATPFFPLPPFHSPLSLISPPPPPPPTSSPPPPPFSFHFKLHSQSTCIDTSLGTANEQMRRNGNMNCSLFCLPQAFKN